MTLFRPLSTIRSKSFSVAGILNRELGVSEEDWKQSHLTFQVRCGSSEGGILRLGLSKFTGPSRVNISGLDSFPKKVKIFDHEVIEDGSLGWRFRSQVWRCS
ncbi:hypothetical protein TNCT_717001 [Trichonephila clavata]|uniref:Uncharacterized protein n=1 Tax=Trichonephila clavata TaxID=2740835 RepID=A0A8X6J8H3_TRICU|nr:hypothetical protein TNCT_717001 [Trichonephila clavata]